MASEEIKSLLNELQHSSDLMDDWQKDRDRIIGSLIKHGASCRLIAQHTNLNYKTIYDRFFPNSKRRQS